jgi:hypothetical protein
MRVAGVEVQLHSFLTSVLDGYEWLTSHPGRFNPPKELTAQEARWAAQTVLTFQGRQESVAPSVVQCQDHPGRSVVTVVRWTAQHKIFKF